MNLVLIGYRCTGKTTIGRMLAEKLGWPLVDTDTVIQERAGKSIREIVESSGWAEFRRLERQVIAEISRADRHVISAGGGAILDEANTQALMARGKIVLLTAPPDVVWQRMKADPKTAAERPDLTDAGGLEEVTRVLAERRDAYRKACHYEIPTDRFSPEETAGRILAWLKASAYI